MNIIFRTIGKVIIAAVVVISVITVVAEIIAPGIGTYIGKNFPKEKNLEIKTSFALDPDVNHAAPAEGDVYENDDYIYTYSSSMKGWAVQVKDTQKTEYGVLNENIYGEPVVSMNQTFKSCTQMFNAPAVPKNVKYMNSTFLGCKSLTGDVVICASPIEYSNCFADTVRDISLIGTSSVLSDLVLTSTAENVVIG